MLEGFFEPGSITVVGVAREEGKVGHFVFDNLRDGGFTGPVFPVNPKAKEIHGERCYASVTDLPQIPDLAVIVVPARFVPDVIDECAAKGIRSAIVISAGFKEAGREGGALEAEVLIRAQAGGIRVLGPNCLGLIASRSRVNASFAAGMPPVGGIAFMSQSGALGTAVLDWAAGGGIGLSHFVSLGNRADLSEVELMQAWAVNPDSRVIVGYLESVADGPGFLRHAADTTAVKPVIIVKSGRSDAGARAVSSHTGSLAGSDAAYVAAFRATGVIRAQNVQQMFDFAVGFSLQPLPSGGLAILTNAGGPAVMATDACEAAGVELASLENDTIDKLRAALPPAAALYNPIDILGDAEPERYADALDALYADPNVGAVLCMLTPQAMTDAAGTARMLVEHAPGAGKTTLACFMGHERVEEALAILRDAGIPGYAFPERAVATLGAMQGYRLHLDRGTRMAAKVEADRDTVASIIASAKADRRAFITEESAARIAAAYGIPVARGIVARDFESAVRFADEVGYPVVAKVASPDILHKSDVGGIRAGIENAQELAEAYDEILSKARAYMPDAVILGIQIQEMVLAKREVIIGVDRDPTFGPLLMFGLGGIFVEVLKDVTFRMCPVDPVSAHEMMAEIRGFGLLRGARGQHPADMEAIADVIVRISALATDFPEIIELDINPLMVGDTGQGAVAADIRIGIGG